MKNLYLIALTAFFFHANGYAAIIKSIANGNWNNTNTWDLNRLPQVGDTILITSGKTVTLTADQNLNGFVYLKIFGKLLIVNSNTILTLGSTSSIYVYPFGSLDGTSASQRINIGYKEVYKGSDPIVTGPQMANISTTDFDFFLFDPLPVKFVGFTVTKNDNKILVQWSTAEELNAFMYELERSSDGSNWNTVAQIAAMGTTQNLNNYSYNDKNIEAKIIYYRIKQVDVDGNFNYTSIRSIKNEINSGLVVNIASIQNQVLLQFSKEVKGNVIVRLVSSTGQVTEVHVLTNAYGQVILKTKAKGNYYVSVSNGLDVNVAKQIFL